AEIGAEVARETGGGAGAGRHSGAPAGRDGAGALRIGRRTDAVQDIDVADGNRAVVAGQAQLGTAAGLVERALHLLGVERVGIVEHIALGVAVARQLAVPQRRGTGRRGMRRVAEDADLRLGGRLDIAGRYGSGTGVRTDIARSV